ncbi:vegetative cell wall protein gp1 [Eucalyptus grandis]|uniref:vegetative cell wall protein gp1 n=1 Tax=Eucalyptus grandis TaxID=71139 RepID=UPI00192EC130|nr:vegetative cell wall protein gp1 [Eucalyptus grandis]
MRTSEYGDGRRPIMDFSASRPGGFSDDDSDADADAYDFRLRGSCSFNFHPEQSQSASSRRKERVSFNETLISLIERKMTEHNDTVLHAVEGVSARLSQLETRTRRLENAVDDMKESLEYNHGKTDGKLRELENLLREVQSCTRDLRDKEDIAQAQLQILKLQIRKNEAREEKKGNSTRTNSGQQKAAPKTQQSAESLPVPVVRSQQFASSLPYLSTNLPHSNASTIPMGTPPQHPSQLAQNTSHFISLPELNSQPPNLPPQGSHQQHHTPLVSHSQSTPPVPYFPSLPAVPYPSKPVPTPQDFRLPLPYSAGAPQTNFHENYHEPLISHSHPEPQGPPLPSSPALQFPSNPVPTAPDFGLPYGVPSAQPHNEPTHDLNELTYIPSQNYPQSSHALPGMPFISSHQLQSPFAETYDQPTSRPYTELLGGHWSAAGSSNFNSVDPRGKYNSGHGNSSTGTSSLPAPGMGNDYSQLPVARILPHALPTASPIGSDSSSGESRGNRGPMDDVIDKAVAMGFRRDLVRATAKRLEAQGQHPDLNLLLDTLMSTGESRG